MNEVMPVRVCGHCGEVGHAMDTYCLRCKQRGTLADRFRCSRCARLADEEFCPTCDGAAAIQASGPRTARTPLELGLRPAPDISNDEPPPWLTGLIGGVLFGAVVGMGAGWFLSEEMWVTAGIGAALGGIVGAIVSARRV